LRFAPRGTVSSPRRRDSPSHPRIPACVDAGIRFPLTRKEKPRRSGAAHSMRASAQVTAPGAATNMIVAVSTRPNRQKRSTCSRMLTPLVQIQILGLVDRSRRLDRLSRRARKGRPRRHRCDDHRHRKDRAEDKCEPSLFWFWCHVCPLLAPDRCHLTLEGDRERCVSYFTLRRFVQEMHVVEMAGLHYRPIRHALSRDHKSQPSPGLVAGASFLLAVVGVRPI
jgi:hypothetical protein